MENGISDEAPKNPPPAVPVETIQIAPAITEDVASVTKVINFYFYFYSVYYKLILIKNIMMNTIRLSMFDEQW